MADPEHAQLRTTLAEDEVLLREGVVGLLTRFGAARAGGPAGDDRAADVPAFAQPLPASSPAQPDLTRRERGPGE
ncbi:hypothetical protein [Micromonospora chalcea]|uniref:hypothetical protein n=1 Tax=Micromonospora chalcea TaxID=1874 RepID=UPI0037A7E4C9